MYESTTKTVKKTVFLEAERWIICNKCGKRVLEFSDKTDRTGKDIIEAQEFLRYEKSCGYGSIFGDEALYEIHLCQHCVKEVLGPYMTFHNDEPEPREP